MRFRRSVFSLIAAATVALPGAFASADSLTPDFVAEESGNTWSATLNGNPVSVGLVGITNGYADGSVWLSDVELSVDAGSLMSVYNGLSFLDAPDERSYFAGDGIGVNTKTTGTSPFPQEAFDGTLDETVAGAAPLTSFASVLLGSELDASRDGRYFGVALLAFNSDLLVLDGTSTFNSNGSLGSLGEIACDPTKPTVIPSPSAAFAGGGLLVLSLLRRQRRGATDRA